MTRRTSPRHLGLLFVSIASTASGGCGGAVDDHIDVKPFDKSVCEKGNYPGSAMDLRPGAPVDGIQLRTRSGYTAPATSTVVATSGEPCKTAKDKTRCLDALGTMVPTSTFFIGPGYDVAQDYWLATTSGDDVRVYGTAADVRALLVPIDTADEAALVMAVQLPSQRIDCAAGNVHASKTSGWDVLTRSGSGCGDDVERHVVHVAPDGTVSITATEVLQKGDPNCAIGRRPPGLASAKAPLREGLGALFARIARLEAASVPAFERLEHELRAFGAPASLLAGCRRAARDESRHARAMTTLARRHGAEPELPVIGPVAPRSLETIAMENAIEGCVRETFGALVATHQAINARDRRIARVMRRIAEDETRHAALSWTIDAWVRTQLDDDAIARLDAARADALRALSQELEAESSLDAAHARAGFPAPAVARRMLSALASEVVEPRAA
jgi:hypothetical protein